MRIFVNELSLSACNASDEDLVDRFREILQARTRYSALRRALYCSRGLAVTEVRPGRLLMEVVRSLPTDERRLFLAWVAKFGPFLDDDRRQQADDDLFFFNEQEVTELGLGEAARWLIGSDAAGCYSFTLGNGAYAYTPIEVIHGFPDEPLAEIPVPNYWTPDQAVEAIDAARPEPTGWHEFLAAEREQCPNLLIGSHCDDVLAKHPFAPAVARRGHELFAVLNKLVDCINENGELSETGKELQQQHFVGEKAWFTDESDQNKADFAADMTFPDPSDGASKVTYFWHGKIKTPQYRIHFEWPIAAPYDRLKVGYFGPKITKR